MFIKRSDRLILLALCSAHFVSDSYSSVIYPLLPLLKTKLALTSAQVFWLAPLYAVSSSLMQPFYGFVSDRYARRFFAVFGPAITAVFVSLIGLAPSYGALIVLLVGGGVGIGSFHPQGAAMASAAVQARKRVGLAMFSAAGTLGFAIGPLGIAFVTHRYGLERTYYVIGFGLLMSALLYRICPPLAAPEKSGNGKAEPALLAAIRSVWKPLLLLYLITVIRSGMQMTTNTYLPFFLNERGYSLVGSGAVLTVFLLLGGLGGLAGGLMAERISGRAVTLFSGLLAAPLMMTAFLTTGPLSIVMLGLGGFMLLSTIPVNVAMAQELVPGQTSTVSALMMGAAWGVGALAPPLLDQLIPTHDSALVLAAGFTLVSAVLGYFLPRQEAHRKLSIEPEIATAAAGD